jgi:2-oxoisovalerate dehydrogenase E1 component
LRVADAVSECSTLLAAHGTLIGVAVPSEARPLWADRPPARPSLGELYRQMLRIRRFEERAAELFKAGEILGTAHSCVGQEAVAVGVGAVLRGDDYVVGHHRSHGHVIAKGGDLHAMMAELLGRRTGYCRGLGGSMHIADLSLNILGCNGIVGAPLPIGVGAALSSRLRGSGQVAVVFFGDGGANQGAAHEAMNLAATWELPVVFVCENNQFALSVGWRDGRAVEDIAVRASGYGMPGEIVDGNDVLAVEETAGRHVEAARRGEGPSLIEAKTFRRMAHSMRANLPDTRDQELVQAWEARDPVPRFEALLVELGELDAAAIENVQAEVEDEVEAAIARALADELADPADMEVAVYERHAATYPPPAAGERALIFTQAVREALWQEMETDESVFVMGEDVGKAGGVFRATEGMQERFGPERVRDTPISECGFVGAGVGAALTGMRPVVELQFSDFVTVAMDQLANQAAKLRFMMGGTPRIPLVVRGASGGGVRLAAQHSQSLEALFCHLPGLVVVMPSNPADAKGLLAASIRDDNPVIFLEQKQLFFAEAEPVPEERYAIPLGRAAVARDGSDVTVVATGAMVPLALRAAGQLEREGTNIEVIDPRTLYPLDLESILASVARTNRVVVVHEAVSFCGLGGEIAASIAEHGFWDLDAPPVRVGAPHRPIPYQKDLELQTIPGAAEIVAAVRTLG